MVFSLNLKLHPTANDSGSGLEPQGASIPSPRQTGRGSGRGVRFTLVFNCLRIRRDKLLFFGIPHYSHTTGSPFQRFPKLQQTAVTVLPPFMIPKPESFDALFCQIFFAPFVALNSSGQTMLKTIKFNIQLRVRTVKIQNMSPNHMLPAKFESGKSSPAQCLPESLLLVGLSAAKLTSDLRKAHMERMHAGWKNSSSSPRPSPRLARRG